ncbi:MULTISPECIES: hypothetical protein [Proteus]|uniref:hypothetical protein n=1 Tax=Proteus TaxID=583 RepID=UPI00131F626B|nr:MULTISPECIES: hypothetical protein [Proteus]MBI6406928.1 hypothetical protein [Proteus sp. PR00208]MDM3562670.1 hypothetical protein [Proteus vulgaris]QHD95134.1 hypothetical protein GSM99_11855 [Proteus terrae subsp. cibarius]QJW50466.1 hypothetical protein HND96_06030 [Proteus terrae subsp. cibarius]
MNDSKEKKDDKVIFDPLLWYKNACAIFGFLIIVGFIISLLRPTGLDIGFIHFGYNRIFGLYFRLDI